MVEFAFIFPLVLLMIVGVITGAFLYFMNEGLTNGTRAGSRWGTIENLYSGSGSIHCEQGAPDTSGTTQTIVSEVKFAANIVPVNTNQLCTAAGNTTTLTQAAASGKADIQVDAWPSLASPQCVTVTVTYTAPKFPGPWGTLHMKLKSSAPTNTATSGSTCPVGP